MSSAFFVVPRCNVNTLCRVEGGELVEVRPLPVPLTAPSAWSPAEVPNHAVSAAGWVAWFEEGASSVQVTHCDAEPGERFAPLELPSGQEVWRLAFHREVLYAITLGGRGEESAFAFDFGARYPAALPVTCPEGEAPEGLDVLAVGGGRLFVAGGNADGWCVRGYDLSNPVRPRLFSQASVGRRSNSEAPSLVAAGERFLAVLSCGYGFGEEVNYLTLFDLATLRERASFTNTVQASFLIHGWQPPSPRPVWQGLAWDGDRLLLAAGAAGVGVLDAGLVVTTYLPAPLAGALRVHALPGAGKALAVVGGASGQDSALIDLPG